MEIQVEKNDQCSSIEQRKNLFTEPKLEVHEELLEITGQFAGTFSV